MIKDRIVILAKGAPNRLKDGRETQCAIAVSPHLGLIRIYPLHPFENMDVKIWSVCDIEMEKHDKDTRDETYKPSSIKSISKMDDREDRRLLLEKCSIGTGDIDPINFQNNEKKSIIVMKAPKEMGAAMPYRECDDPDEETFGAIKCQRDFPYKPMISWTSLQGVNHETNIVGQEVYEYLRCNTQTPFRLFENLQISNPDYEKWLVLGTLVNRRNVWCCPHIHRIKKSVSGSIPLFLPMFDGVEGDWPYSKTGGRNVKPAGPQMEMNLFTSTIDTITLNSCLGNTQIVH